MAVAFAGFAVVAVAAGQVEAPPDAATWYALVVTGAPEESVGAKAGLKLHDILAQVNGEDVDGAKLDEILASSDGKRIKLRVLRSGKPIEIEATPKKPVEVKINWAQKHAQGIAVELVAQETYRIGVTLSEADDTLRAHLSPEVYEPFAAAIEARNAKGYSVEASFAGVREVKLVEARFDPATNEGDIAMRFVGELTSVVRDPERRIVEGAPGELKQQKDVWTFTRDMASDNPNWLLTGTGG